MSSFFQVTLSLVLVLALILVVFKWLQRIQGHALQNQTLLKIRSSIMVGPREKVILLEADGQQMLIGVGAGQVRFLTQLASAPQSEDLEPLLDTAAPASTAPSPSWLKQQLSKIHAR